MRFEYKWRWRRRMCPAQLFTDDDELHPGWPAIEHVDFVMKDGVIYRRPSAPASPSGP